MNKARNETLWWLKERCTLLLVSVERERKQGEVFLDLIVLAHGCREGELHKNGARIEVVLNATTRQGPDGRLIVSAC